MGWFDRKYHKWPKISLVVIIFYYGTVCSVSSDVIFGDKDDFGNKWWICAKCEQSPQEGSNPGLTN